MRKLLLLPLLALALAAPTVASATGGDEEMGNKAQTAQALAVQALALMLAHPAPHEDAIKKLDAALAANVKGEIDLRALSAAHEALHNENNVVARRLLEQAFPGQSAHIIGVTFRPASGTAQVIAGIAGVAAIVLAGLGLVRRRTADREHALS